MVLLELEKAAEEALDGRSLDAATVYVQADASPVEGELPVSGRWFVFADTVLFQSPETGRVRTALIKADTLKDRPTWTMVKTPRLDDKLPAMATPQAPATPAPQPVESVAAADSSTDPTAPDETEARTETDISGAELPG